MGNWSEQQEAKKEVKEKDKVRRETLGKFFFDLAKLAFAGLFVSWITPLSANVNNSVAWSVLVGGVMFTVVFAMIGNKILNRRFYGYACYDLYHRNCYWDSLSYMAIYKVWEKMAEEFVIRPLCLLILDIKYKEVIYGRFIDCAWWFWNVSLFLCYMVKYPERQKMAC